MDWTLRGTVVRNRQLDFQYRHDGRPNDEFEGERAVHLKSQQKTCRKEKETAKNIIKKGEHERINGPLYRWQLVRKPSKRTEEYLGKLKGN